MKEKRCEKKPFDMRVPRLYNEARPEMRKAAMVDDEVLPKDADGLNRNVTGDGKQLAEAGARYWELPFRLCPSVLSGLFLTRFAESCILFTPRSGPS
jgi:hypothetical protein